ncbi:MAG: alkaline phosphatase family protein [Bryobacteraceae bacterium]
MKKLLALLLGTASLLAAQPARPKLVVAITVDQFRYDYLSRFRASYTGGIDRLLKRGAVFADAHYEHFPTVTAIGHSTIMSGATPSTSGIIGNDWFDRQSGKTVTSVSDDTVRLLGAGDKSGSSPRRLLVSTLGDELKMAGPDKPRLIGISMKDRSAILPVGHMADGAYWFDEDYGAFVSSTYYFPELPAWVKDFNAGRPSAKYLGADWKMLEGAEALATLPKEIGSKFYKALKDTPYANDLVEEFAERAVVAEQLGAREVTDLLALSFSANDYIGHAKGPDSQHVRDVSIRTDRMFDKLFRFLDSRIGMQNVLVVMTADHGVAPVPEVMAKRKMPGGRMPAKIVQSSVQAKLSERFGEGKWILSPSEHSLYLDRDLIRRKNLDRDEVVQAAADVAAAIPHVARVYTQRQLVSGTLYADQVGRRVLNGFYAPRGADVMILLEPYWMFSASGTTHGTAYSYDSHVPMIFMGPGVKAGRFSRRVSVNDIAPTLAALLDVETPSGSAGRVLEEIFAPAE